MIDYQYEDLLARVRHLGTPKGDRTGTGTKSMFGGQLRYDLTNGFPLITTKQVHFKSVVGELLWFLSGNTNIKWLQDNGIRIWDAWADESGNLGPVYGAQWVSWPGRDGSKINQIERLIEGIKRDPDSRRHIVSAWNVSDLDKMALAPCHAFFQFYVADGRLSCQITQRSADMFLGVPFNIASYALLTHMIAQQTDLEVGELLWSGGDIHVYNNHLEQVDEQLSREPYHFPTLNLKPAASIDDYTFDSVELVGYVHHPKITAPVAV